MFDASSLWVPHGEAANGSTLRMPSAAGLPEPIPKAAEEVSCGWNDVSDVV